MIFCAPEPVPLVSFAQIKVEQVFILKPVKLHFPIGFDFCFTIKLPIYELPLNKSTVCVHMILSYLDRHAPLQKPEENKLFVSFLPSYHPAFDH